MAYSEFTIKKVKEEFGLDIIENKDVFGKIEPIEVSDYIKNKLNDNVSLALAINTEKARSEFIIRHYGKPIKLCFVLRCCLDNLG